MSHRIISRSLLALVAAAALAPGSLTAQLTQVPGARQATMSLEALKPSFDSNGRNPSWTAPTAAYFLSARIPINDRLHLVTELPFSHAGLKGFGGYPGQTSNAVGNPYLGIESRAPGSALTGEVGVRLPAVGSSDNYLALSTGMMADMDRMEAFLRDLVTLSGVARYEHQATGGAYLQVHGGPTLWIHTESVPLNENVTDLWAQYGARAGFRRGQVDVSGGFTGRAILSEEEGSFSERSFHHVMLDASFGLGRLRPGVHLRQLMDDELNRSMELSYVIGLSLTVQLR